MEPTPPSMTRVFAEVLWIYRPLIYLLMLYRCGTTSWKPWFTSLVLDLASRRLNMPVKVKALLAHSSAHIHSLLIPCVCILN